MRKIPSQKVTSEINEDFANLRKKNTRYLNNEIIPYKSGDGFTAYVIEKYAK